MTLSEDKGHGKKEKPNNDCPGSCALFLIYEWSPNCLEEMFNKIKQDFWNLSFNS